ncbi:MAG: hypothetical protein RL756_2593 [Pseudomonadota bacterium]
MRTRGRLALCAILLVGTGLLAFGAVRFAGSEPGAAVVAAALERSIPALRLEGRSGTLLQGRIASLRFDDGQRVYAAENLAWQLDPGCLARFLLCLRTLTADTVRLETQSDGGTTATEITPLDLPLGVDVAAAEVRHIELRSDGAETRAFADVEFALSLRSRSVEISRLEARFDEFALSASGTLGFERTLPLAVQATVLRAGWPRLRARAQGDLSQLTVEADMDGDWPLTAKGTVTLQDESLPFRVEVQAQGPLTLPNDKDLGVLDDAVLTIDGDRQGATARFAAKTGSPWIGSNRLAAELRWAPDQDLEIASATLDGESGRTAVTGTLALVAPWRWQLAWTLSDVCLPRWRKAPGCTVQGALTTRGEVTDAGPTAHAQLELAGTVADRPATLAGNVMLESNGTTRFDDLVLASSGNRFQITGSVGTELDVSGTLELLSAAATLPDARGQGSGSVRLTGTPDHPHLGGTLRITNLALRDWSASTLDIDVRWRGQSDTSNELRLAGRGLALPGLEANHLTAVLSGTTKGHAFAIDADIGDIALALRCNGSATARGDWSGRCSQLDLNPPDPLPHWQLEQPLALTWVTSDRRLSMEPFCLRAQGAAACSRQRARIAPNTIEGISVRARDLPVALVAAWLPPEVNLTGTFGFELDAAHQTPRPIDLTARLTADDLRIESLAAGEAIPFDVHELEVTARSEAAGFRLTGSARTGDEGRLAGTLLLDQVTSHAALAGEVSIANIDIGPLLRTVPGTLEGAGQFAGHVTLGGRADAPTLAGEIAVENGRFAHEDLPEPIEDLRLTLRFADTDATFDGRLRTRAGAGDIDGKLHFKGDDWTADLRLRADELLVEPRPGTRIRVVPDITVALDPTLARIRGRVQIPEAEVDLEHLPQTAISVSSDTVIIGQAPPDPGIDYSVDLELLLGERVHLRGLGADARLSGSLRLLREPGTALRGRGDVNIISGRYTAYGQRLDITEGTLLFRGPLARPGLRITAVRRIEDEPVTVGVEVRGDAKEPQLKVFSQPTMPESRALYYLLTGRAPAKSPANGSADGEDNELALGSAMMQLGVAGAGKATGKVLGRLGIEDFQVDSRKVEGGTEVQLSGYLTPALYLRYGVSTFDRVNTLRLRYRLTPKVFIEAISGVESAVDVLYSFSR